MTFCHSQTFFHDQEVFPLLSPLRERPPLPLLIPQEADIRKFFHTILENPHFVTDPRTLEGENQNGPLDTPVPREKNLKSGKSG